MKISRKEKTAYHEAGHAVAALVLERLPAPKRATIIAKDGSLGCVTNDGLPRWFDMNNRTTRYLIRLDEEIVCLYCGSAAQYRLTGRRNNVGAASDFEKIVAVAVHRFCHMEGVPLNAYLRFCRERAAALVDRNWTLIEGVAAALLEKGTLNRAQICDAATSSLRAVQRVGA